MIGFTAAEGTYMHMVAGRHVRAHTANSCGPCQDRMPGITLPLAISGRVPVMLTQRRYRMGDFFWETCPLSCVFSFP